MFWNFLAAKVMKQQLNPIFCKTDNPEKQCINLLQLIVLLNRWCILNISQLSSFFRKLSKNKAWCWSLSALNS